MSLVATNARGHCAFKQRRRWPWEAQRTLANPTEQATWLTGSGSVWLYPLDRIDIQVFNLNRLVAGVDRHYTAIGLAMEVA